MLFISCMECICLHCTHLKDNIQLRKLLLFLLYKYIINIIINIFKCIFDRFFSNIYQHIWCYLTLYIIKFYDSDNMYSTVSILHHLDVVLAVCSGCPCLSRGLDQEPSEGAFQPKTFCNSVSYNYSRNTQHNVLFSTSSANCDRKQKFRLSEN